MEEGGQRRGHGGGRTEEIWMREDWGEGMDEEGGDGRGRGYGGRMIGERVWNKG